MRAIVQIGQIISLTGDAILVSKDGSSRPATVHDIVAEGDQVLLLGPHSSVMLMTPSGERLLLNQQSQLNPTTEQTAEIETLLLDEEFDPSALPAPSAGPPEPPAETASVEHGSGQFAPELTETLYSSLLIDDAPLLSTAPGNADSPAAESAELLSAQPSRDELTPWNNPEPRLLGTEHHSVTEDFIITRQGNLNHQHDLSIQAFDTRHGQVAVGADGAWHYRLHNDSPQVQALGAGESLQESFSLKTHSGDFVAINLTIHGSNDTPSINGHSLIQLLEDHGDQFQTQNVSASGILSIADADTGQSQFLVQESIITPYGNASLQSDGTWHYQLHTQSDFVQGLKEGQHVFDAFHAYSQDGTRHTIRIDIEGSNDKPILSGKNDGLIEVGQNFQTAGKIDIVDPDFGESTFQANTEIVGRYGSANIDASGHWQYTLDETAISGLPEGRNVFDVMNIYTQDGTRQDLVIKIVGNTSQPEMLLGSANALELHDLLQDNSTAPALDGLLGSTAAPDWNNPGINSGEALSIALADSTLTPISSLPNNVDVI